MFAKISRVLLCVALLAPVVVVKSSFFPFITGKAIFFRTLVEFALVFFLLHVLTHLSKGGQSATDILHYLKLKLRHPLVIAAGIFAVMFVLTALISPHPTQSFWSNFERGDGAFQIIHYVIFFILAVLLFPDLKSLRRLLAAQVIVSLPISLYALGQMLADQPVIFLAQATGRVSGTLGNPSYLAAYLLITLAIITYLIIIKRDYIEKFTALFIGLFGAASLLIIIGSYIPGQPAQNELVTDFLWKFILWYLLGAAILFGLSRLNKKIFQAAVLSAVGVFSLYIILKTGTRGAFLALLVGFLVLLVSNMIITKHRPLRLWLGGGVFLIVGLSALFFATHTAPIWKDVPVLNRLIDFESARRDIEPRIWTWGSALSGALERPITGWGAENFPDAFDTYYNAGHFGRESFFDRTHNIFLEYLISGGILVFAPWLSLFIIYYLRLRKRQKDFWYTILFTVPIVYLVQGFFLFDTLPIYIALFLFLIFFITTEQEHTVPYLETRYSWSIPHILTGLILIGALGASLYATTYLPARKNYRLVQALLLQNRLIEGINAGQPAEGASPQNITAAFRGAYETSSPVGQEETIGMYQKFVKDLIEVVARSPAAVSSAGIGSELRGYVTLANTWYDTNLVLFPGLKQLYLNGGLNLQFGFAFSQADLVSRGKQLYNEALERAPTRLEIIRVLIEVAKIEKDEATFTTLIEQAKRLRPDLVW